MINFAYVTMYLASVHQGDPLFCDRGNGLLYHPDTVNWVALPPQNYGITWFCGDDIVIWDDGVAREFKALDSWVHGTCIEEEDDCILIGADIPEHLTWWEGLSTRAIVVNKSEVKRRLIMEIER